MLGIIYQASSGKCLPVCRVYRSGSVLSTKLIIIRMKLLYRNLIPDGSDVENVPGTKRVTGEEGWTKIKACQLDAKSSRALKENLNVEKGREPMFDFFK